MAAFTDATAAPALPLAATSAVQSPLLAEGR